MKNKTIEGLIQKKMKSWDGNSLRSYSALQQQNWQAEMYQWASKVRRDILVLEYHLQQKGVNPADLYGDPGDPPPPQE